MKKAVRKTENGQVRGAVPPEALPGELAARRCHHLVKETGQPRSLHSPLRFFHELH